MIGVMLRHFMFVVRVAPQKSLHNDLTVVTHMNWSRLNMSAMLQETLHKHTDDTVVKNSIEAVEESLSGPNAEVNGGGYLSLFTNWPLMSAITVYCIFSLQDVAYAEVIFVICLLRYFLLSFSISWFFLIAYMIPFFMYHFFDCCCYYWTSFQKDINCRYFLFGLSVTRSMVD